VSNRSQQGFTLVEFIIAGAVVAVVAAIATPSFIGFMDARRLESSQEKLYLALREAQSKAKQERVSWQVSFRQRNSNDNVEWAIHPATGDPDKTSWYQLDSAVRIIDPTINPSDPDNTTFQYDMTHNYSLWKMLFDYKGNAILDPGSSQLGRITIGSRGNNKAQRCVIVSTLLGGMRLAKNDAENDDCN
jgi:prepilin-type N-terminal cleavage/methylation domain-containing protein